MEISEKELRFIKYNLKKMMDAIEVYRAEIDAKLDICLKENKKVNTNKEKE